MVIGKTSRQLILALFSLAFAAHAERSVAQHVQAPNSLTIERIADERDRYKTLPHDLVWSPDGKLLSYIRTTPKPAKPARGSLPSEIWSIDAASGQEKTLVSAAELGAAFDNENPYAKQGDEEDPRVKRAQFRSYAWAPDGHTILLATGASLAWFNLDSRTSRRVVSGDAEIGSPGISPDGQTVSFVRDHTLWLVNASTGAVRAFAPAGTGDLREGEPDWVYSHELGAPEAYWWSPDSSSIAWIETDDHEVEKYALRSADGDERSIAYPKPGGTIPSIRLFAQPVSGGKPLQIDLGSDKNVYFPRVQWLPDGKHLAIERLSRNQKTLDLLVADKSTGVSRVVLTEKDAYWINLSNDLRFLKDSRRFLWSSERSGYRHLYLYDLSGRQLAQLTQGNWEVTSLDEVDEAAGSVYFTATEASPLERQLYRVNLDGSGFTRITKNKGTHAIQFSKSGDVLLDTWSTHDLPPSLRLLHADGGSIASLNDNPDGAPSARQTGSLEFVTVKTHMGADLNAWIMKPPDFDPARRYPLIVYIAGGPGEQVVRDQWGGELSLWFALMAQKGYIVFALDGRGSAGRGHLFEEPVHLRFSAAEMADERDGIRYLSSQPWIDKTRIGICGWRFGGFLALHGMLDPPLLFKAGFAGSPVTDWHSYDAVFAERYLEDPVRNQDGWLASSPLDNAKRLTGPLLLAQATLDEKVHLENSLMLLDELLDKGKYADILLFPDRGDLFDDRQERLIFYRKLTEFFEKNL